MIAILTVISLGTSSMASRRKKKETFHFGQPDTDCKLQPNDLQYSLKFVQIEAT